MDSAPFVALSGDNVYKHYLFLISPIRVRERERRKNIFPLYARKKGVCKTAGAFVYFVSLPDSEQRPAPLARWFVGAATGTRRLSHFPTINRTSNPPRAPSAPSNPTGRLPRVRRRRGGPIGSAFLEIVFDPRGPHFWIVDRGGTPPTDGYENFSFFTF